MEDKALRIKQLIAYIGISNGKFADAIGVYRSDFSSCLSGRRTISEKLIDKIVSTYPMVRKSWLMVGDGEMLAVGKSANIKYNEQNSNIANTIPYFALESAACGALSGFGSALTKDNSDGAVSIPTQRTKDGDIFIQTRGRSMIDTKNPERSIPEGAMVLVRKWTQSFIEWGEIYCVATTDGYVIKKLLPGFTDSTVKCVSAYSDNYPPYQIPTIDIKALGRVIAIVSTQML